MSHSASDEWQSLSVPFKLSIENGMSPSGRGYFVNGKDIYLSVRYIGMEVVSFYADNDSVFLYDRMHSTLIKGKLGENPVTHTPLTITDLQNILLAPDPIYSTINLSLNSLVVNLTSTFNDDGTLEKWAARLDDRSMGLSQAASLQWNFDGIEVDSEKLPKWKRPANPKKVMGLDEFYGFVLNNL